MRFFSKKETLVQSIAFMAVFAGLDALLSLFGALIPEAAVFLSLFAPLISAVVSYFCRMRHYVIYAAAAIVASLLASFWNLQNTVFYLLPALALGAVYGGFMKIKAPASITLFLASLVEFGCFFLSSLLVQALYGVSMKTVLLTFVGLQDSAYAHAIYPLFILGYCYAQMGIVEIVTSINAERLGMKHADEGRFLLFQPLLCLVLFGVAIGLVFVLPWLGYLLLGFSCYFGVSSASSFLEGRHLVSWIVLGGMAFVSFLLFGLLFRSFGENRGLILLGLFPLSLGIGSFVNTLLNEKNRN